MLGSPKRMPLRPTDKLLTAIARTFKGGLDTYDPPLNLSSQFVTESTNVYPDANGTLRVRFGTSRFADLSLVGDEIIAMEYYINALICVFRNGNIASVDSVGVATLRWDTAIAATRPSAPAGWSQNINFASFAQFGGKLIICNGVDKPLIVDSTLTVNYLADVGTGSNVNVPRAKYVITHNNYLVMAVTPTESTKLYITNKGTSGTFVGDPAPNDAVNFETSTYVSRGYPEITGLGSFRDKLIVTYAETILPVTLGTYDGTTHVPSAADGIDNFGSVSHKCIVPMGDDILFLDKVGIASVQRALISATMTPTRESLLVSRDLQAAMVKFSAADLSNALFAINDRIASQVLFFIPKVAATDTVVSATVVTLDPATVPVNVTLSEGNLRGTRNASTPAGVARATLAYSNSKKYFQIDCTTLSTSNSFVGLCTAGATRTNILNNITDGVGVSFNGSLYANGINLALSLGAMTGKLLEVAVDFTARKVWFRRAEADGTLPGNWNNTAGHNPSTDTGGISIPTLTSVPLYAFFSPSGASGADSVKFNFGATAFLGSGLPTSYTKYDLDDVGYTRHAVPADAANYVYVFCVDKSQRFRAMTLFDAMPYRCGARSGDGRIFFGNGTVIHYYRNQYEPLYLDDAIPGSQAWSDATLWDDGTGWAGEGVELTYTGSPIAYAVSTPWTDHKEPEKVKASRYLHCMMDGDGVVNIDMYTDRFEQKQLSMSFVQSTYPGSSQSLTKPLNNDGLYAWNANYTRARLRVHGTATEALSLLSVGLLYLLGGYRR